MTSVYWHKGRRLCYDQTMIDEMFCGKEFQHYNSWPIELSDGHQCGIVVIPGRQCMEQRNEIPAIRQRLQTMKWAVVLVTGDEESLVDHTQLMLPNTRVWVMSPVQSKHQPPRFLINGSQPQLHSSIRTLGKREKTLDWCFLGQVTHPRRLQCVEQLRKLPNGYLLETAGFLQGVSMLEYYAKMLSAKVVPCPSGPVELSTARIFEAIECGAVPVVDGCTPYPYANAPKPGYWEWFFGGKVPFPIIYDWAHFPKILEFVLLNFEDMQVTCRSWWRIYKYNFKLGVETDIVDLETASR